MSQVRLHQNGSTKECDTVGGSASQSGVVRQPAVAQEAVVAGAVRPRKRRLAGFPWNSQRKFDVPWESRTYVFSWADGGLTVLDEEWNIQKDGFGRVQGMTHARADNVNVVGYPEMTYKQAKAIEEMSAKTGCSLKVAFAKTFPMDQLTKDQLHKIALAPELFAPKPNDEAIESSKREVLAQFEKETGVTLG